MKTTGRYALIVAVAVLSGLVIGLQAEARESNLKQLALTAASGEDSSSALAARDRLRAEYGRTGFKALWNLRDTTPSAESLPGLNAALDHVGGARYSSYSGLYWHTELSAALDEGRRTNRPVLSLRMLGKLTDEYSCANSRFFRTTLYVAPNIAAKLKQRFVLHWKTVRPVPILTINYGDGRVLRRTITGNSAHYVLAADGRPLDVLPGLHAPVAFQSWLDEMFALNADYAAAERESREALLRRYHANQLRLLTDRLDIFRSESGLPALLTGGTEQPAASRATTPSSAMNSEGPLSPASAATSVPEEPTQGERAAEIAAPKSEAELPLVRNVGGRRARLPAPRPRAPGAQSLNPSSTNPRTFSNGSGQVERVQRASPASQQQSAAPARFSNARRATDIAQPKMSVQGPLVRNVRGDQGQPRLTRQPAASGNPAPGNPAPGIPAPDIPAAGNPAAGGPASAPPENPNGRERDEALRKALTLALRAVNQRRSEALRSTQQDDKPVPQRQAGAFSDAGPATRIAAPKRLIQAPLVENVRQQGAGQQVAEAPAIRRSRFGDAPPITRPPVTRPPVTRPPVNRSPATRPPATRPTRDTRPISESEIVLLAAISPELRRLDPATLKLIAFENPTATHRANGELRRRYRQSMIDKLREGIARDTIRNEYDFHLRAHRWMSRGEIQNVEQLDRRVYDELFLMPFDDEWLGLVPASAYTGLRNNGLIRDRNQNEAANPNNGEER